MKYPVLAAVGLSGILVFAPQLAKISMADTGLLGFVLSLVISASCTLLCCGIGERR